MDINKSDFMMTIQQAGEFMSRLDVLRSEIYKINFNLSKKIDELFPMTEGRWLKENWGNLVIPVEKVEGKIESLKQQLLSLESVVFYLAEEPSEAMVRKIKSKVEQYLDNFLIDIRIDKKVLGGAIIEYKGKIGNYSLASKL